MIDQVYLLKWIITIFIAGFIGYFGKFLAKTIISKLRKRKEEKLDKYKYKLEKEKLKLEKKKLKMEKKKLKD